MEKKIIFIVISLCIIIIGGILFFDWNNKKKENLVCFKDNCFRVELALTPQERERGLMFREYLDLDKGMLFVFEEEKEYPFWMKNTLIPLDIIWINSQKVVVFMKKNVQPCKEKNCEIITPNKKAKYILEIKAGISDQINIKIGDKLIFDINTNF